MSRKTPRAGFLMPLLAALLLLVQACGGSSAGPTTPGGDPPVLIEDTPLPAPASPARAVIDRTLAIAQPGYVAPRAEALAEADLIMIQLRAIFSEDGAQNIRDLRALNPDIVVIGSIQLLTIFPHWNDSYHRTRMTLGAALWDAIHDRPAHSTTSETVPMWDGMDMLNPMRDGQLDEAMLNEVVEAFREHFERYPGIADGIMHDYTSESPWIYPHPDIANIGEVDLDQDGIGYADDPAEQAAWIGWQEELFRRLQRAIGPGLIQIANGRMAVERPSTMQLIAGAFFEDFPTMTWHQAPRYGYDRLDELAGPGGLVPRRGRTWNLISSPATGAIGNLQLRRMANLLYDGFYSRSETHGDLIAPADDQPIEIGAALGAVSRTRADNGDVHFTRAYEEGDVLMIFTSSGAIRTSAVSPR